MATCETQNKRIGRVVNEATLRILHLIYRLLVPLLVTLGTSTKSPLLLATIKSTVLIWGDESLFTEGNYLKRRREIEGQGFESRCWQRIFSS